MIKAKNQQCANCCFFSLLPWTTFLNLFGGSISGFTYFILFFLPFLCNVHCCLLGPVERLVQWLQLCIMHLLLFLFPSCGCSWNVCAIPKIKDGSVTHTHTSHKATYVKSNFLKAKYLEKWRKINKRFQKVFVGGMFDHSTINIWRWQTEVYWCAKRSPSTGRLGDYIVPVFTRSDL